MRVVTALRNFRIQQRMTRDKWDRMFSRSVQLLLCAHMYVTVRSDVVFLTLDGLKMLESNPNEE